MASGNTRHPASTFDSYLHDYLVKKKMHKTAEIFKNEAHVDPDDVAIDDSGEGFLHEWWSIFYDVYSKQMKPQQAKAEGSVKATQVTENDAQQALMAQLLSRMHESQTSTFPRSPAKFDGPNLMLPRMELSANDRQATQVTENDAQQALMAQLLSRMHESQTSTFPRSPAKFDSPNLMLPRMELSANDRQATQVTENDAQQALMAQLLSRMHESQTSTCPRSPAKFDSPNLMLPRMELSANDRQDHINADGKPVDVESFLSHNDENAGGTSTPFRCLKHKHRSSECTTAKHKVPFKFEEVVTLHSNNNKVLCCHFSSDGKLLASAGHENKVSIWNMDSFGSINTSEEHSLLVTDVRFRPSSTIFATSSFDRTVKIWDAAMPSKSLCKLLGHAEQVMSVDFHPRKLDLLCSCDRNNEIRLWSVIENACKRVSKGATKQVRFQPQLGNVLAAAAGNSVYVIDVETDGIQLYFKGHVKDVISICWDRSGSYIGSVSEDSARIWSAVSGGKCIYEIHSNGNKFQSCTFHPGFPQLLIIGGYQFLELWNPSLINRTLPIPAHNGLIAGLATSQETEMVASASHDHCVKLWK